MRQKIGYLIKLLIGVLLVIWILSQVDQKKFIDYFQHLGVKEFIYVCILGLFSLCIQYIRWKFLVNSYGSEIEPKDLFPSFLAGFTLRLMIPGGHAEWSKAFLMSGRKKGKIVAVGMEKILPAIYKLIMIGLVLPISFPQYKFLGIGLVVGTILIYFISLRLKIIQNLLEKKVSTHYLFFITSLQSTGIFLLSTAQYYILLNQDYVFSFLNSMHANVYLWAAGIFPVSISGLGIREGLAIYFFRMGGVSSADAVATSLYLFTLNTVLPALIGIYYLYNKKQNLKTLKDTYRSSKEFLSNLIQNSKEP